MSETSATKTLRTHLKAQGEHSQRFEDKLSPGVPDTGTTINGTYCFLEGKFIKSLPANDSTFIRFGKRNEPRLAHQRNWLVNHRKANGLAFWWVRVRDGGWYLFPDKFNWLVDGVRKDVLLQQENLGSAKAMVQRLNEYADEHVKGWL